MTDIALVITEEFLGSLIIDVAMNGPDLATDDGMNTAVIISLFSDRLANDDDAIPDGTNDRRGWWGDSYADVDGDLIGSRLWLLARANQVPQTLTDANTYGAEALAWFVEDGVASAVDVQASFPQTGLLGLAVTITKPNGDNVRFNYVWKNA